MKHTFIVYLKHEGITHVIGTKLYSVNGTPVILEPVAKWSDTTLPKDQRFSDVVYQAFSDMFVRVFHEDNPTMNI